MSTHPKNEEPLIHGGQGKPDDSTGDGLGPILCALVVVCVAAFALFAWCLQLASKGGVR